MLGTEVDGRPVGGTAVVLAEAMETGSRVRIMLFGSDEDGVWLGFR